MVIGDKLCWREHIELLHIKLSKLMDILKVASLYLPHDVLLLIFYLFFNSQLHYGLLVSVNTYVSYLTPIQILYKRCIILLSCEHPYAHTPPLTLQLRLVIFDDLFTYFSAVFLFKIVNNKLPSFISCLVQCLHGSIRRNTRDYFLPIVRLEIYNFCGVSKLVAIAL